jgi:putative serine protease PepD
VTIPDPTKIEIALTTSADEPAESPAEPTYVAEVVNADGYLDLAVIRVTGTIGGAILEEGQFDELEQVAIGDSDDVRTGDDVRVLGFPSSAQSDAISLTRGVIQGVVADPDLDTNRAYFNVDARISGGNSGGMAASTSGKLIGVPTIVRADEVGSVRPINLAKPLIEAAQEGEDYTSPYAGT